MKPSTAITIGLAVVAMLLSLVLWILNDIRGRVINLEGLIHPLLVEYQVQQRVAELRPAEPCGPPLPPMAAEAEPGYEYSPAGDGLEKVREDAEHWATEAINAPQQRQGL